MTNILKKIAIRIPGVPLAYRTLLKLKTPEHAFTDIYTRNEWGGEDSVSGTGSDNHQTHVISNELRRVIDDLNVLTLLDIPCGDFYWMNNVDLRGVHYTGADIVKELIQKNREKYNRENVCFENLNLIKDKLQKVDLIFCRDCLVHLSFKDIFLALQNICASQSEFFLTTTFTDRRENRDIATGQWRVLNLEIAPFMLPKPLRIINEECTEGNGIYKDKSLALWRIRDIRESLTKHP